MKKLGKFKTLTIASLSAVALAAPIAYAQSTTTGQETQRVERGEGHGHGKGWGNKEGRGGRGEGRGWGGERGMMFRGIDLTEDQKTKMKQIGQSFRERTQSLHQELRSKRQELRQASEGGTFNEALATQKLQESASLEAKLMGEQFRMRQEMQSVLTPEQKTQLEQKRAEFKAKRANHGERKVQ
ncbi:MAG TPA: Spy/CpxP family protein refolding chaperone [Pyrinomonadaceae bacterium]|jgi:protein CpxP|nr:Spy/CpxP family protein refolding chaperone [Pyrinomonadaceae bacterium]